MQITNLSCQISMKLEFSGQIFEKYWNIRFHKNPFCGGEFGLCGQTNRQTDMTRLTIAFRTFLRTSLKIKMSTI